MKKQTLVRDATVMLLALFAAYAMVMLTQAVMGRIEGVAMLIFMLAVFVTSMYTEGYAWGVAASLISVLAVNFAFLFTLHTQLFLLFDAGGEGAGHDGHHQHHKAGEQVFRQGKVEGEIR